MIFINGHKILNNSDMNEIKIVRKQYLHTDGTNVHFEGNNFGRIIVLQMIDHILKICQKDLTQC